MKEFPLRVLLVEDSADDAELLLRELRRGPWNVSSARVENSQQMLGALDAGAWDVVLADYSLPAFGGMEALSLLKRRRLDTPFILVSGTIGEETAVEALKSGADDYLMKDRLGRLVPAVRRSLEEAASRAARRRAEEGLIASLEEKEVLLREIHHRVKNNLQVVYSLVNLQTRHVTDPRTLEGLRDCRERVRAMAMVHEKLCRSKDLSRIDFGEYIRDLTKGLAQTYEAPGVSVRVESEGVRLGIDEAVPCGLMVHELVSNCLKHAFPGGRGGEVVVEVSRESAGGLRLEVRDDGVGFPGEKDVFGASSLGLQLIRVLAEQLQGRLVFGGQPGTRISVDFPYLLDQNGKEAMS